MRLRTRSTAGYEAEQYTVHGKEPYASNAYMCVAGHQRILPTAVFVYHRPCLFSPGLSQMTVAQVPQPSTVSKHVHPGRWDDVWSRMTNSRLHFGDA